jgi:uncharacterized protein YceH (UPF0502 family)
MGTIVGTVGLAAFAPALLCGGMMVVCMVLMGHGMRKGNTGDQSAAPPNSSVEAERDTDARVADLEAEVARLRRERDRGDVTT